MPRSDLAVQRHRERGTIFFRGFRIVDAAGLGEPVKGRAVTGRNHIVFGKGACGRPIEGDESFVTQIRRPQAKDRAIIVVAATRGRAIEPLAHLYQRTEGFFAVACRPERMDDRKI